MKRIISILLFPTMVFCQQKTIEYKQTKDIEFTKNYKNYQKIQSYTTKDGFEIKKGTELTIGKAEIDKEKYRVHDCFKYITVGKSRKTNQEKHKRLSHRNKGNKVVVQDIFVTHIKENNKLWTSRKNTPLYISLYVKNPNTGIGSGSIKSAIIGTSTRTILDIEKAIEAKEIINPSGKIRKEEALEKLREAKDLLELEVITKKEYEEIKKEMTPYIKK